MAKRRKLSEEDATILDYLNEDCWHHVLQYVPARDVILTERASRRWQEIVLRYLRGIHISIDKYYNEKADINKCRLKPDKYESFLMWTNKLGSSVVAAYCNDWAGLETIGINCPNVKTLKLEDIPEPGPESPQNLKEHFKCLQHLNLLACSVSDLWVSQFLADKSLKKLEFSYCDGVTGECLSVINTSNLQKLRFELAGEDGLQARHMVSAVEHLGELTELRIGNASYEITEEIQAVLDKMPKLEQLDLNSDHKTYCHTTEPLSRLTRLKSLSTDIAMRDEDLEIMMIGCRELRSLKFWDCQCMDSDDATEVLARYGTRLTTLLLDGFGDLNDDGVLTIIRGCTQLKSLDIEGTWYLTPKLPERAEAAWFVSRPWLRLEIDLSRTNLDCEYREMLVPDDYTDEQYDELERQLEELRNKYEDLRLVFDPQSSDPEQDEVEDDTDDTD